MEIGDTTKEAVKINGTTPESDKETEPTENAENTEKSGNTIIISEIVFTLEDFSSDYEQSGAEKLYVLAKWEAASASKTDTNLDKFICDKCNGKIFLKRGCLCPRYHFEGPPPLLKSV